LAKNGTLAGFSAKQIYLDLLIGIGNLLEVNVVLLKMLFEVIDHPILGRFPFGINNKIKIEKS